MLFNKDFCGKTKFTMEGILSQESHSYDQCIEPTFQKKIVSYCKSSEGRILLSICICAFGLIACFVLLLVVFFI